MEELISKLILIMALFFTWSARANEYPSEKVIGLVDQFRRTMTQCPERIWSNYNWNGLNILFMYPSQDDSWIWDINTHVIRRIDNRNLFSSTLGSLFDFFEIIGKRTLSLNMEDEFYISDNQLFSVGVHELFHYHGQRGWSRKDNGEQPRYQGTVYPMDDTPRYYRRMLFDNIARYFASDNNEEYLKQGKYWFDKWVDEYPDELVSSRDNAEGTAVYVETMARALATSGCTATEEQLKNRVLSRVRYTFGSYVSGQSLALDREGYDIGGLAALILRFNNSDLLDWNQKMAEGNNPLEVLFEGVTRVPEDDNESIRQLFSHAATAINREYGLILDDDIENYSNKDYIRVPAPDYWRQSTLSVSFFAYSNEIGKVMSPHSQDHHFISPAEDGSDYIFKRDTVAFRYPRLPPHPCPGMYNKFVLVHRDAINIENRVAHASNEIIEGRLVGELKEDDEGYSYFCVE